MESNNKKMTYILYILVFLYFGLLIIIFIAFYGLTGLWLIRNLMKLVLYLNLRRTTKVFIVLTTFSFSTVKLYLQSDIW